VPWKTQKEIGGPKCEAGTDLSSYILVVVEEEEKNVPFFLIAKLSSSLDISSHWLKA
jgi:hypothetical protein